MKTKILEKNLIVKISRENLDKVLDEMQKNPRRTTYKIFKKYNYLYPSKEPFLVRDLVELRRA
jgi:hypothetical protein